MRKAFEYLISGCVVYLVVAACSASSGTNNNGTGNNSTAGTASNVGGAVNNGGVANNNGGEGTSAGTNAGGTTPSGGNSGSGGSIIDDMMDPVPNAQAQSGSRLKANWMTGADGSKQFYGWHDSMLNIDCSFYSTTSGQRCLASFYPASTYFSDANCTDQVVAFSSTCYVTPYVVVYQVSADACPTTTIDKIYTVGAAFIGVTYVNANGTCTAVGAQTAAYTLGAEVPLTNFAAATLTTDP